MIYSLIKSFIFLLDAEISHTLAMRSLLLAHRFGLLRSPTKQTDQSHRVMGLTFPNRVGLAAGLDKNADYVDALGVLGFGFIEIGTVTPKPQSGNPKPRLFRLVKQEAIINRMGFNGKGVDYVVKQLEKTQYRGILGINLGKNKDTPNEKAVDDYLIGMRRLWRFASYFTINLSSPNTPGLRDLQQEEVLGALLRQLKAEQTLIANKENRYIPLVVKISPDLADEAIPTLANILLQEKMDGVIATNTTITRDGVLDSSFVNEAGGLSGRPLQARSTDVVRQLSSHLKGAIPIIASGGVMDARSANEKIAVGASLVQVYTGLIYRGPALLNALL